MPRRRVQTAGLSRSILEAGTGPLVLLLHGFPELAISWRAQIDALAVAGFHAVAPDMRGYGDSDKPDDVQAYAMAAIVNDMVDLVAALGERSCVVVGHDFGAAAAWQCGLRRSDVFRAVFALSVPFQPRRQKGPPTAAMAAISKRLGQGDLYINRFQADDAHRPMDADPAAALRRMFYAYDGATPEARQSTGFVPGGVDLIGSIAADAALPPWMTPAHFAEYVAAFAEGGFKGPLDWYRNIDRNWAESIDLQDRHVTVPAGFMVGDRDPVRHYAGAAEAEMKDWVDDLRIQTVVPGAGHWIQQERPDVVNRALLDFLATI